MANVNNENQFLDQGVAITDRVNSASGAATDINYEDTNAHKLSLATQLSNSGAGVVAVVIVKTGTYLKVKWLKGGKKIGMYKSRKWLLEDAQTALENQMTKNKAVNLSATASLAITGTNSGSGAGTNQWTATLTRADASTEDVTAKATWSSATPAKATVDQAGLVTRVAAGTSVITATYGGRSNTRTMTVS